VVNAVLAIGPKVRGFKPGRGDGFLKGDQICSTIFFGRKVKKSVSCRKILRHVKRFIQYERDTCRQNSRIFLKFLLLCY
jgi:hypothetical protein